VTAATVAHQKGQPLYIVEGYETSRSDNQEEETVGFNLSKEGSL
jgi:hypothetical protein